MKQSKRLLISLLVVVLLTFCTLTAFAAADEAPALKIAVSHTVSDTAIEGVDNTVGVQKDDVLTFTVKADENTIALFAAELRVKFDSTALELVADSVVVPQNGTVAVNNGEIIVSYLKGSLSGDLLTFDLKVTEGHGDTDVTVTVPAIMTLGGQDVAIDWTGDVTTIGVHSYGEETTVDEIPTDCTAGAKVFRACTVDGCDAEIVLARPNEEAHDASGAPADCLNAQICAREGCEGVVEAALDHAPNVEAPTCTTAQVCTRENCPVEGKLLQAALPHDTTGPDATCTAAKTCKVCGTELAPMIPHDETGPEATCIAPKVCKYGCGKVLAPKLPHNTSGPDADCVNPKVCANEGCTAVLAEKLGHDVSGPAADCVTAKVCAREGCGVVLLAALGHDENGKPATCTTDKVCARPNCNFVIEERFGHDESGADATCALPKTCVTCGVVLVEKLDTPEAHVYGEWVVETEATMSSTGSRYKVCTLCEDKVTEEIPEKSSAWLIILIVVGVLVLVGGGVAVYFLSKNKKAKAESEETTEENSEEKTEEVTEAPAEEATEEKTEE